MSTAKLRQETYLPEAHGQVARIYDFLKAHEEAGRERPEPRYFLAGADPGDRTELPGELYRVLRHVVEALQQGLAVTVAPLTQTLTTQQAAELLGVSRPTLIKLLNDVFSARLIRTVRLSRARASTLGQTRGHSGTP
jgi:hypothetical protein